jgi:hypothetical protein
MDEDRSTRAAEHLLKGAPRLRFRSAEESLEAVREGVHRWWWEFLRLSKPYWLVCQTSQRPRIATQDSGLARVYRAFGNVYDCTFDEWWLDRGSWVFREREQFPKVSEVARAPRERPSQNVAGDHIWVDIPLKLSRRTIQRQLGRILDAYDELRVNNRLELSTSAFRLNPVQFRLHTLRQVYEVHSLHRELVAKPRALKALHQAEAFEQRADLFRIGKLLRVSPSNESLRGDPQEITRRQNRMRASVSRLLRRSELLIANLEQGVFPSFKPVEALQEARFTTAQLEVHAELELQWWSLDLTSSLSTGKLDEARKIHYEEQWKTRQAGSKQW